MANRKEHLETILSKIAGVEGELTIRDEAGKKITFSFDGPENAYAGERLKKYFDRHVVDFSTVYDAEDLFTCVYIDLN